MQTKRKIDIYVKSNTINEHHIYLSRPVSGGRPAPLTLTPSATSAQESMATATTISTGTPWAPATLLVLIPTPATVPFLKLKPEWLGTLFMSILLVFLYTSPCIATVV